MLYHCFASFKLSLLDFFKLEDGSSCSTGSSWSGNPTQVTFTQAIEMLESEVVPETEMWVIESNFETNIARDEMESVEATQPPTFSPFTPTPTQTSNLDFTHLIPCMHYEANMNVFKCCLNVCNANSPTRNSRPTDQPQKKPVGQRTH